MLMGHLRVSPSPPEGLFPFLSNHSSEPWRDPSTCVSMVSFAHRPRSSGGAFYDYTARYGAVREEDRLTLRESMFAENVDSTQDIFDKMTENLGLKNLLDLPLVALSNGQTRRARILRAVLSKPELLLLDEPLSKNLIIFERKSLMSQSAGLDANNRSTILSLLRSLHLSRSPRVIMGIRAQDPIPHWISHLAFISGNRVIVGPKDEVLASTEARAGAHVTNHKEQEKQFSHVHSQISERKAVVELNNVAVSYHERKVSWLEVA